MLHVFRNCPHPPVPTIVMQTSVAGCYYHSSLRQATSWIGWRSNLKCKSCNLSSAKSQWCRCWAQDLYLGNNSEGKLPAGEVWCGSHWHVGHHTWVAQQTRREGRSGNTDWRRKQLVEDSPASSLRTLPTTRRRILSEKQKKEILKFYSHENSFQTGIFTLCLSDGFAHAVLRLTTASHYILIAMFKWFYSTLPLHYKTSPKPLMLHAQCDSEIIIIIIKTLQRWRQRREALW